MDWGDTLKERSRGRCPCWWQDTSCCPTHIVILIWVLLIRTKWVLKAALKLLLHQSSQVSPSVNTYFDNMEARSSSERGNFSEEVEIERPVREPSQNQEASGIQKVIEMLEANEVSDQEVLEIQRVIEMLEGGKDNVGGKKLNYNYEIERPDEDEQDVNGYLPPASEPIDFPDEGFEEGNEVVNEGSEEPNDCQGEYQIRTRGQRKLDPFLGRKRHFSGGVSKFERSESFEEQRPVCPGSSHKKGFCCTAPKCPAGKHSCCVRVFLNKMPTVEEINETCETLENVRNKIVVQLKKQDKSHEKAEKYFNDCIRDIENTSNYGLTRAFLKQIRQRRLPYGKSLNQFRAFCNISKKIKLFPHRRAFYIKKYGGDYLRVISEMYHKIGNKRAGPRLA